MKKTTIIVTIVPAIITLGIITTLIIKSRGDGALKTDESESYISCGCGCCVFDEPLEKIAKKECLYKSRGESIQDKINQDRQLPPHLCANAGCSFPIKYVYCD